MGNVLFTNLFVGIIQLRQKIIYIQIAYIHIRSIHIRFFKNSGFIPLIILNKILFPSFFFILYFFIYWCFPLCGLQLYYWHTHWLVQQLRIQQSRIIHF
jgi:hypothetical protein